MVGLLNHKVQKQTDTKTNTQIPIKDLTKCSIVQIIHCIFVESVFCLPTRLLSVIVSFSCIYSLQGSVATQLKCSGIYNNRLIVNCPQNASIKNFKNWLIFGEDIDNHKVGRFWDTV